MKKYQIIYADPPWQYHNKKTGGSMKSGSSEQYPTMTMKEIENLPINLIADKNSVLFLWATVPLLPEILPIMKKWEYKYKTCIFWRKIMSLGMGFWYRGQVEILLFGIKGKIKAFRYQHRNIIQAKVLKHSQKPEEFRKLIEDSTISMGKTNKIELFARQKTDGWDVWGNEVESDIVLKEKL